MKIGMVGLGRMGGNMAERLVRNGHEVVGYARREETRAAARAKGVQTADCLDGLVDQLPGPRIVWVMVPDGDPTEQTIRQLAGILSPGDIIVDGGNSNFRDSIRRAQELKAQGLAFLDAGTSGGIWGLTVGYCLMVGGDRDTFRAVEPVFAALAPHNGYLHAGPSGAGHFVKMVHNGIEYGLLEAYAEGFEILQTKKDFDLDLAAIARLWNQGSVVRSWLLELAQDALKQDPDLGHLKGYVDDSGEGRWTVLESIAQNVPAPVITLALLQRFRSRQDESYGAKFIAALRNEFGGHAVKTKE